MSDEDVINKTKNKMSKTFKKLEIELSQIRTGIASSALFDNIKVDYYDNLSPLNQVANISSPEPRIVVIQPWDKALISKIEKAILKSDLALNPVSDGKILRINIPPLTDERRKELIKLVKNTAESGKISIRNIRRDSLEEIKKSKKSSEISEDEEKKISSAIQKTTDNIIKDIDVLIVKKQEEINEE